MSYDPNAKTADLLARLRAIKDAHIYPKEKA